jgi:hypothetical protein
MGTKQPKISHIDITEEELEALLRRVNATGLPPEDLKIIKGMGEGVPLFRTVV